MRQAAVAGPEIERLIQLLARLPGFGPRSARRAALHLIKKREQLMAPLAAALQTAMEKIVDLQDLRQYRHAESLHGLHRPAPRSVDHRGGRRRRRPLGAGARARGQRAAITCSAARCRRSTASARRISPSTRWSRARMPSRGQGGDPGAQRHGRRPDHRALHHRAAARRRREGDAARAWRAGRRRARLSRRGHAVGGDQAADVVLSAADSSTIRCAALHRRWPRCAPVIRTGDAQAGRRDQRALALRLRISIPTGTLDQRLPDRVRPSAQCSPRSRRILRPRQAAERPSISIVMDDQRPRSSAVSTALLGNDRDGGGRETSSARKPPGDDSATRVGLPSGIFAERGPKR